MLRIREYVDTDWPSAWPAEAMRGPKDLSVALSGPMIAHPAGCLRGRGLAVLEGISHSLFERHRPALGLRRMPPPFFELVAGKVADRRSWHALGLSVHLLLGTANLVFWSSFLELDALMIGIVTTALHIVFICAQAACLWRGSRAKRLGW